MTEYLFCCSCFKKVSQMQKQVDDMSRDLRLLEETIQSLNWTTELQ